MLTTISEEIDSSDSPEILIEFQKISGIEQLVCEDSEGFDEPGSYENLLSDMGKIDSVDISNISSSDEGETWQFHFDLNGNPVSLEIETPDGDWLSEAFIPNLNALLGDSGKKFRFVNPHGGENADQFFYLAFIDDELFSKLQQHKHAYAFVDEL